MQRVCLTRNIETQRPRPGWRAAAEAALWRAVRALALGGAARRRRGQRRRARARGALQAWTGWCRRRAHARHAAAQVERRCEGLWVSSHISANAPAPSHDVAGSTNADMRHTYVAAAQAAEAAVGAVVRGGGRSGARSSAVGADGGARGEAAFIMRSILAEIYLRNACPCHKRLASTQARQRCARALACWLLWTRARSQRPDAALAMYD
jgi:hypothetical protein